MATSPARTGAAPAERIKVRFGVNKEQYVRLEIDAEGVETNGNYGTQYQYFLAGNQIMWVDPEVRDAIIASGAKRGDEVAICKEEIRTGNHRHVQWSVQVVGDECTSVGADDDVKWIAPPPPPPPPAPPVSQPRRAVASMPATQARAASDAAFVAYDFDGPFMQMIEMRMSSAWIIAERVRAASNRRVGGDFGLPDWQVEDLRAIAITIFIEIGKSR